MGHKGPYKFSESDVTIAYLKEEVVTLRKGLRAVMALCNQLEQRLGLSPSQVPATAVGASGLPLDLADLDARIKELEQFRQDALLIGNLSYFYALLAQKYRTAYKEIGEVVEGKTTREALLYGARDVLVSLFLAGLAGVSAGLAQGLVLTISAPFVQALSTSLSGTVLRSAAGASDDTASDAVKEIHKNLFDIGAEDGGDAIASALVGEKFERKIQAVDPLVFFLDAEVQLRKLAARIHAGQHPKIQQAVSKLTKGITWHTNFDFLKQPITATKHEWEELEEDIESYVKRMIWRMHCRSQWGNTVSPYVVCASNVWKDAELKSGGLKELVDAKDAKKNGLSMLDGLMADARSWPSEVWSRARGAWPAHWGRICSDFAGREPEHQSNHIMYKHSPWISVAVYHCCQVKRDDPGEDAATDGMRIDLERHHHEGQTTTPLSKSEKALMAQWSDYDLLFADTDRRPDLIPLLQAIHTKGGRFVTITEIRRGHPGSWRLSDDDTRRHWTASSKKLGSTSASAVLNAIKGDWITVFVQASSRGTDVRQAKISIYEAAIDPKGAWEVKGGAKAIDSNSKNFASGELQHMSFPTGNMVEGQQYVVKLTSIDDTNFQDGNAWSHRTRFDDALWRIQYGVPTPKGHGTPKPSTPKTPKSPKKLPTPPSPRPLGIGLQGGEREIDVVGGGHCFFASVAFWVKESDAARQDLLAHPVHSYGAEGVRGNAEMLMVRSEIANWLSQCVYGITLEQLNKLPVPPREQSTPLAKRILSIYEDLRNHAHYESSIDRYILHMPSNADIWGDLDLACPAIKELYKQDILVLNRSISGTPTVELYKKDNYHTKEKVENSGPDGRRNPNQPQVELIPTKTHRKTQLPRRADNSIRLIYTGGHYMVWLPGA
jgi:hypothetical protein